MERFINQIDKSEPIPVRELRSLEGNDLNEALQKIHTIRLNCYVVDENEFLSLFQNLKNIELFRLSSDEFNRFLNHLEEITVYWRGKQGGQQDWGIEGLMIRECQLSSETSNCFCTLIKNKIFMNIKQLEWIPIPKEKNSELGEKNWIKICNAISTSPFFHLRTLSLPNHSIGSKGCKELAQLCIDNRLKSMCVLNLEGNRIGNTGLTEILRTTQFSNIQLQLEEFNISNNNITSQGVKQSLTLLKQATFPKLQSLSIGNNPINKKAMWSFFHELSWHSLPELKTLNCSGISLGEEGVTGLIQLLRYNYCPSLEQLILHDCKMGEKELLHLSYCIQDGFCKNITHIDLSSNNIKRKELMIIRRMLCKAYLPNLHTLNLNHNAIGNDGIEELGNITEVNCLTQVHTLLLNHNHITDEGASCIYLYIRNNQWRSLKQLYLDDNNFSKISVIHLRSLVEMNNKLQIIHLNEMTKQRDPYIHTQTSSRKSNADESAQEENEQVEEENEQCLREIFEESTELIVPPCFIKRTSTEENAEWNPVQTEMTPISEVVGMTVDSTPIS